MKAIFESDILTSRFQGIPRKIPDFVAILKEEASIVPQYGTINLDPDIPAVMQIWPEIKVII